VQHRNPKRPQCRKIIKRYHVTPYVNDVGVYLPGDLEKLEEKTRVFFQILPLYDMQRDVKIVKLLVMYFIPREDDLQLNILILLQSLQKFKDSSFLPACAKTFNKAKYFHFRCSLSSSMS